MQTIESDNQTGKIIENVKIRLAEDSEIQVQVPEEIFSYYKNDPAYKHAFTTDGWYGVGTLGISSPSGIIISKQKDSTPALPPKDKLVASDIKMVLEGKCHYISFTSIIGAGGKNAVAILFPNTNFFSHPDYEISPLEGCFCPRDTQELGKCLTGCLNDA
ncbi:MAG TPA: hypothetical protein VII99_15285, partial [Bacteroidia bacterium]